MFKLFIFSCCTPLFNGQFFLFLNYFCPEATDSEYLLWPNFRISKILRETLQTQIFFYAIEFEGVIRDHPRTNSFKNF